MITVVTSTRRISFPQAVVLNVLRNRKGSLYVTYEVATNFMSSVIRPKSTLIDMINRHEVDTVIQVGYTGHKTKIVKAAEALDLNVILIRSM